MADHCFTCDAPLKGLTTTCTVCGSVYRRGELISEGKPRPDKPRAPPIRKSAGREPKCPSCGARGCRRAGDLFHHTFQSHQPGKTREEAIERMFDTYDRHPGRRRLPARESFEVVQARKDPRPLDDESENSFWVIYVRKRRVSADSGPALEAPGEEVGRDADDGREEQRPAGGEGDEAPTEQ